MFHDCFAQKALLTTFPVCKDTPIIFFELAVEFGFEISSSNLFASSNRNRDFDDLVTLLMKVTV